MKMHVEHLGSKALDVVLFPAESVLCDEHGKVGVAHAKLLNLRIEPVVYVLPHLESIGAHYVAACQLTPSQKGARELCTLLWWESLCSHQ